MTFRIEDDGQSSVELWTNIRSFGHGMLFFLVYLSILDVLRMLFFLVYLSILDVLHLHEHIELTSLFVMSIIFVYG
jgi:hypothetical protein